MTEPEKSRELTAQEKTQQESFKLFFEVYKHITTLSSGTIVILATFLEKIFKGPKVMFFEPLAVGCISFLILSIISSLSVMAQIALAQQVLRPMEKKDKTAASILYWSSPITFILGITCLAILAFLNLHSQGNQ